MLERVDSIIQKPILSAYCVPGNIQYEPSYCSPEANILARGSGRRYNMQMKQ